MRLTLRTLLAYLDDMLEEDDAQLLKSKIEDSGIAATLITRIQNSVDRGEIGALSPDAIGPLENANVMSEYLDSTLPPEQIAEIERLCLDSDTSLAEAAACHQILTVVLGQPARVSDRLKHRIYELPHSEALLAMESQTQPAADARAAKAISPTATTASSEVEIPTESPDDKMGLGGDSDELGGGGVPASAAAVRDTSATTAIRPVGLDDSGVSDASARLRNDPALDDESGRSEAEIVAGATRDMLNRTDGYGGGIRPSRITPWLVTLAMAAVVLYALGQIFAPLSKPHVRDLGLVAMEEIDSGSSVTFEPEPKLSEKKPPSKLSSPAVANADLPAPAPAPAPAPKAEPVTSDPSTTNRGDESEVVTNNEMTVKVADATAADIEAADTVATVVTPNVAVVEMEMAVEPEPKAPVQPAADIDSALPDMSGSPDMKAVPDAQSGSTQSESDIAKIGETETAPAESASAMNSKTPTEETGETTLPKPPMEKPVEKPIVAELTQPNTLVIVRDGESWARVTTPTPDAEPPTAPRAEGKPISAIELGQTVIAPAYFRPVLVNQEGLEWTLAGPTRMKLGRDRDLGAVTQLIDGRVLLASTKPNVMATLILGNRRIKVAMPDSQTVLAIELTHLRQPGMNPLVPENRLPVYSVTVAQGKAMLQSSVMQGGNVTQTDETVTLETGQHYQGRGVQPPTQGTPGRLPPWIDAPSKKDVLVDSAREGLMEFVSKDEPIEKSLREAMAFRRVEVAALAAETLLLLGRADVYFGTDGILNRPRQRLYWQEHFDMLRQQVASSAPAADAIRAAIERAEFADSRNLYKLLVGFSPAELEAGGDEKLVELLDSASMAVRVLAIENLRLIVGDTLGYRADQENANSRKSDIKKWETRLRRGDIKYKE